MRGLVLIVLGLLVGVAHADAPPSAAAVAPTAEAPASPQQLAAALADELEPAGETDTARIVRQRAELVLIKRFGFQPDPIDPVAIRFRTSFYPLLHRAAVALAARTGGSESPRSLLGPALFEEEAVLRLVPFVVAELLAVVSRDPAEQSEWESLLTKQLSFFTAILERTAILRLGPGAPQLPTLDPAEAGKVEAPVDLLAVDYRGPKTAAALSGLPMPSAGWDATHGEAAFRAAFRIALRSLGGVRPSAAEVQLLGYDPTTSAGGLIAAYGSVVQPFVDRAASATDFATGWAAAVESERAATSKMSVDVRSRTGTGPGAANLFVYMIKMIALDPQLSARKR